MLFLSTENQYTFKGLLAYVLVLFLCLNRAYVITTGEITMTRQPTAITAIMPVPNSSLQKKCIREVICIFASIVFHSNTLIYSLTYLASVNNICL